MRIPNAKERRSEQVQHLERCRRASSQQYETIGFVENLFLDASDYIRRSFRIDHLSDETPAKGELELPEGCRALSRDVVSSSNGQ